MDMTAAINRHSFGVSMQVFKWDGSKAVAKAVKPVVDKALVIQQCVEAIESRLHEFAKSNLASHGAKGLGRSSTVDYHFDRTHVGVDKALTGTGSGKGDKLTPCIKVAYTTLVDFPTSDGSGKGLASVTGQSGKHQRGLITAVEFHVFINPLPADDVGSGFMDMLKYQLNRTVRASAPKVEVERQDYKVELTAENIAVDDFFDDLALGYIDSAGVLHENYCEQLTPSELNVAFCNFIKKVEDALNSIYTEKRPMSVIEEGIVCDRSGVWLAASQYEWCEKVLNMRIALSTEKSEAEAVFEHIRQIESC